MCYLCRLKNVMVEMNRRDFRKFFLEAVTPLYDLHECEAMLRWYVQDRLCMPYYRFTMDWDAEMMDEVDYRSDVDRLAQGEPLQHIIGFTEFCGLRLSTDARALIPRPETEELVETIVCECADRQPLQILDIGTGSGAIAIALAARLPQSDVTAVDISAEALSLAAHNACENHVRVEFVQMDVLQCERLASSYDLIVSNPPYIPERMRNILHRNVVNYEPGMALFVPDECPLLFYEKIAELACSSLKERGSLYFETYEEYHPQLVALLKAKGFAEVESRRDGFGRPRFVRALR